MKLFKNKTGLTLVEILVTVAIVAVLMSIFIVAAAHVKKQSEIKLAESTIAVLVASLEQYHDYKGEFPPQWNTQVDLETELKGVIILGVYDLNYSSSAVLYFKLNQIPASRRILDSIQNSLKTYKDASGGDLIIEIPLASGNFVSLVRIIDPWDRPLRYTYQQGDNFPVIRSDGSDGVKDTDDDITSR